MSNVPKVVTMPAGGEVRIIPSERELRNLELRGGLGGGHEHRVRHGDDSLLMGRDAA